jgi:hypothetical protein
VTTWPGVELAYNQAPAPSEQLVLGAVPAATVPPL